MLETRPMAGKGKRSTETTIRLADGTVMDFPVANPNPYELVKALSRRRQRLAEARLERMRRKLAARERDASSVVEKTYTQPQRGSWVLDLQ